MLEEYEHLRAWLTLVFSGTHYMEGVRGKVCVRGLDHHSSLPLLSLNFEH